MNQEEWQVDDMLWFRNHEGRTLRLRDSHEHEYMEQGVVMVKQLYPGCRLRKLLPGLRILPGIDPSEEMLREFFDCDREGFFPLDTLLSFCEARNG